MPHIQTLFSLYKTHCETYPDLNTVFDKSNMVNRYNELDLGFFPLGSGILNYAQDADLQQLAHCDVFVLGNDFGKIGYVTDLRDKKEKETNPTIRNLISEHGLGLDASTTFFTNLFMGLRTGQDQVGMKTIKPDYRDFCLAFLKIQIECIKPKLILILGKEVLQTLIKLNEIPKQKQAVLEPTLMNSGVFTGRHILPIPHPSYAHVNWKGNMKEELRSHTTAFKSK
jgi:Uracil DNA glycosylase superfamily